MTVGILGLRSSFGGAPPDSHSAEKPRDVNDAVFISRREAPMNQQRTDPGYPRRSCTGELTLTVRCSVWDSWIEALSRAHRADRGNPLPAARVGGMYRPTSPKSSPERQNSARFGRCRRQKIELFLQEWVFAPKMLLDALVLSRFPAEKTGVGGRMDDWGWLVHLTCC